MNEDRDALDRELKAMLAVDPSADLQTRIRAQVVAIPAQRNRWFVMASGLTAATAVVTLLVMFMQPKSPENIPSSSKVEVEPPKAPSPEPASVTIQPVRSPAPASTERATVAPVQPMGAETGTTILLDPIRLPPLPGFELTNFMAPIPEASAPSIARLEPLNIEPLSLAVRTPGVSE
jgi:hypothetical protein